tara:strand:- start:7712 stop:8413 length:702 start_codon:yes stop_codon:yes gene_type:complete
MQSFAVIIPAAGKGERFRSDIPKQYSQIEKKTILSISIDIFTTIKECKIICVPVAKKYIKEFERDPVYKKNNVKYIEGGNTRSFSIRNSIAYLSSLDLDIKNILIHDAVRPCLDSNDLTKILDEITNKNVEGAILATPLTDTLKEAETGYVKKTLDRTNLWRASTPQIFTRALLEEAYLNPNKDISGLTDDSAVVEDISKKISILRCLNTNIKITYSEDLEVAKFILKKQGKL